MRHSRCEGCAPQEKWLAFEDLVDWSTIALIVPRADIASIPARVNATDAAAMRANIGCAMSYFYEGGSALGFL